MNVIDFRHQPLEVSQRRLADLPDRVVKGDPRHETHLHFRSTDGSLIAGSWTSTPGKWRTFKDRDEYCHIITGRCALISEAGQRWEFGAGQSFMIPNGFPDTGKSLRQPPSISSSKSIGRTMTPQTNVLELMSGKRWSNLHLISGLRPASLDYTMGRAPVSAFHVSLVAKLATCATRKPVISRAAARPAHRTASADFPRICDVKLSSQ